jgi:uncharacterized RDD family membrane protein YckC
MGPFGTANCLHFAEISIFARLGSEGIGSRGFGAREVLLQGSYYEVSLVLVGVVSLAFFYYTIWFLKAQAIASMKNEIISKTSQSRNAKD